MEANATLEEVVDELKRSATKDKDKFQQYESRLISLQADLESLVKEKTDLVEENASLHAAKNNSEELLEKLVRMANLLSCCCWYHVLIMVCSVPLSTSEQRNHRERCQK